MSLFQCEECGCRENTAVCNYWSRNDADSACKGRKLCSACDPDIRAKVGWLERELSTVKQSLTVEPVAYAAFADNGNIRMWCRSAIGMCELIDEHGNKAVPLYTHPADQVADDLTMVKVSRELLELLCEMVDLHDRRGAVLTVHMEHLRALLANQEGVKS